MATYYPIPLGEMDEVLRGYRFAPVDLTYRNRPVKEWVYERRLPRSPNHFVRVYTGVQRYGRDAGRSRKVGKDAIRVQVVYRDEKGETLVSQPKRVHRVEGWRENLQKRMNEISSTLPQVEFDSRGEPMTLRKHKGNYFWGSRDYPKYKETKRFASEDEEITLKEFDDTDIGPNRSFKTMEDKITFMLRKTSKINRHGDIGCPVCGSIGMFYSEPISKGRKWHCFNCLYEDKIESIKSRGDITLEKYGLLIECPICEKLVKAYNQDSMNRHMKKCKEESS